MLFFYYYRSMEYVDISFRDRPVGVAGEYNVA